MAGKDPYPAVLDDILEGQAQGGVANIPLLEIPVEHIVGVKSQGRVSAFTAGFLPLLNPDSEFGMKWQYLCMAHLGTEGIRDLSQYPGEAMEYENIIFDVELLGGSSDLCYQRYLLPLQSGRLPLPSRLAPGHPCYDIALEHLRRLENVNRERMLGYELQVKGLLLSLLSLLVSQSDGVPPSDNTDTRRLKTILQYVTMHYTETLPVAEAAAVCQCSPSHFMRWFKQMTGQGFTEYLNAYRLNTAAELLRTTDDTVLAVAEQTGFKNLSYFNRAFKTHYGLTPKEYRRR